MNSEKELRIIRDRASTVFGRTVDIPREVVWSSFIDLEQFPRWWGWFGKGLSCRGSADPGGEYIMSTESPEGEIFRVDGIYVQMGEPERLVFTIVTTKMPDRWHEQLDSLRDGPGKAAQTILVTIGMTEKEGDRTQLSIRSQFQSSVDREAFIKLGMVQCWADSLDRLEALALQEKWAQNYCKSFV